MSREEINKYGPVKLTGITLKRKANYAAGINGIKETISHSVSQMGTRRALKALRQMNQKEGFDCPGCAWPDPDDKRSVLGEYCENGAKALGEEATLQKIGSDFFAEHSIQELSNWSDYELGKAGRLIQPMILKKGANYYTPISWEKAFAIIAKELYKLDDPNQAVFYTSGRSSNEAAFLYALFARAFGTNNLPDCSNMCHESSGFALKETLGIGKGSVTLEDFNKAEVVIIIGQNPGTNHPRMLKALAKCKKEGGKIISINPLNEAGLKKFVDPQSPSHMVFGGTTLTDVHLPVRINEDVALLKAFCKRLIKENAIDQEFIKYQTSGYEEFATELDQYPLVSLIERAGIDHKTFDAAVDLIKDKSKIIICWAMGLTQHKNAVDNIRSIVNLLLLKGSVGKEGAGTCPVRGHSNVQGDRTVGIMTKPPKKLKKKLEKNFGIKVPDLEGLDTVGCIQAMHQEKATVFVALGGNFVSAASDTVYTSEALQKCRLTVNISTKLNRTHLNAGKRSLILPTLGRSEQDIKNGKERSVTVENSMGKVHASRGILEPASEQLMSEPEIICQLAHTCLGDHSDIPWLKYSENYDRIREQIEKVINGFDQYTARTIEQRDGFYLPNNVREADFSKLPDGKAKFSICPLPFHRLEEDEFLLMTIRSHDQFNTTIYGLHDRYRGIHGERRVVFMNVQDMDILELDRLALVDLVSEYDNVQRRAKLFHVVPYDIPKGNLAAYFPETNVLIPIDHYADHSRTPISKSVKVKVVKH